MQRAEMKRISPRITTDSAVKRCSGKCLPVREQCQGWSTKVHQALNIHSQTPRPEKSNSLKIATNVEQVQLSALSSCI